MLASVVTTIIVYCVLSISLGPAGYLASIKASSASGKMIGNIQSLSELNEKYYQEYLAINNNPAAQALEARSLGYLADGEVALRINIKTPLISPEEPGSIIYYEAFSILTEKKIKILSALSAIPLFILGIFLRNHRKPHTL
ncbi:hypothetical protein MASR2M29_21240 [Spirochaetota bacterium]